MGKFASAVTLFALGLVLGACGSSSSSGSGSTTGTTSMTATTATTQTGTTSTGTTGTVPTTWSGPPLPGSDGSIAIGGFNEWAGAHLTPAKRVPRSLAVEFLQPSGDYTVHVGRGSATVLRDNLEDDSVRAIRYELSFGLAPGGKWRLLTAKAAYKCQQGRGHQEFSSVLCS